MQPVHRNRDKRSCGAQTEALSNMNVFVNTQPISVNGDQNTHGGGALNAQCNNVFVGNKLVVVVPNNADADRFCPLPGHCNPKSDSGSPDVYIGQ